MEMLTAIRRAKEGCFEFIEDIKIGNNRVRYQTPTGKWKERLIDITEPKPTYKRQCTNVNYEKVKALFDSVTLWTQKDIEEHTGMFHATISGALIRLEAEGIICWTRTEGNGLTKIYSLIKRERVDEAQEADKQIEQAITKMEAPQ